MSISDHFADRKKPGNTASMAKERLRIVVAHERGQRSQPDYLPQLHKELIGVISKYVKIDRDQVQVSFEDYDDYSILELNVTLPERL
jgi:cell division topological specificity factor